jgi:hypothetical protein
MACGKRNLYSYRGVQDVKMNGKIVVMEGTSVENLTLPSGPSFPTNESDAEVFVLTADIEGYARGLYAYDATQHKWRLKADMDTVLTLIAAHANNKAAHVTPWAMTKNKVGVAETLTVPPDYQVNVANTFVVEGHLEIQGEVVIS